MKNARIIKEKILQLILFTAVFFAVIIIVSNIIGFVWLNSALILFLSIIISIFVVKKFSLKIEAESGTLILILFLIVLLAYPVLLITPFYPASNDAVSTTMLRILDEKIPLTHEPYSKINLSYPLGFALITNTFSEVLPSTPDYLWNWIIGIAAGIFQLFFFSLFVSELFKSKKIGTLAGAVFLCGKLIFENFYVGELAWYLGTGFMFCFLYLHLKKNPLQYLFFPIVFVCHPNSGFNLLIILGIYSLCYGIKFNEIKKLALSLVLCLPLIIMSYSPIIYNLLFDRTQILSSSMPTFISELLAVPFWIGTGLSLIFLMGIIISFVQKQSFFSTKEQKFMWTLLMISGIIFIFLSFIRFILAGKEIEVVLISIALISINLLTQNQVKKKHNLIVIGGIILIALLFFSTTSILNHYREGSKITPDGIEFAKQFYELDNNRSRVLFLTNEGGKIAEYANKIPFDVNTGHTISISEFLYYKNEAYDELQKTKEIQLKIFVDGNTDKIAGLDVKYIVINNEEFKKNINYEKILEYKNFVLFKK